MPAYVETLNHILALGTLGLQLIIVLLVGSFLFKRNDNPILNFFYKYGFYFAFAVALSSLGLSLFYSEVVGFTACELCWVQRFFIYPQVILLGIILFKHKKSSINVISGLLAFFGMLVSIYHVYIENGGSSALACATDTIGVVSCGARYVYEFGYITIPVMALTAQVFILLICKNYKYMAKKQAQLNTTP